MSKVVDFFTIPLVSCINIATIQELLIQKVIGHLPPTLMAQVDLCLKAALDLP